MLTTTEEAGLRALAVEVAWAWIHALEWVLLCMGCLLHGCPTKRARPWVAAPFLDAGIFGEGYVQSGHTDFEGLVNSMEEEMATHPVYLPGKIPWIEEPGGLHSPWGHKELGTTERLSTSHSGVRFSVDNW